MGRHQPVVDTSFGHVLPFGWREQSGFQVEGHDTSLIDGPFFFLRLNLSTLRSLMALLLTPPLVFGVQLRSLMFDRVLVVFVIPLVPQKPITFF
jgi:hypothetical protein